MKLTELQNRIKVGVVLLCVENTYRPELNGTRRIITKTQKASYRCNQLNSDGLPDGKTFWGDLPTRAGDIVSSNGDTVTWRMNGAATGHLLTMRFLPSEGSVRS